MDKKVKAREVTLKVKSAERTQKFELQHALALLRLPNSAWEISDKNFIFEDNEIKPSTSTGADKKSSTQEGN